ncbi:MAG: Abortive infection protein, partial [uncultured Arthrobacter sp.]
AFSLTHRPPACTAGAAADHRGNPDRDGTLPRTVGGVRGGAAAGQGDLRSARRPDHHAEPGAQRPAVLRPGVPAARDLLRPRAGRPGPVPAERRRSFGLPADRLHLRTPRPGFRPRARPGRGHGGGNPRRLRRRARPRHHHRHCPGGPRRLLVDGARARAVGPAPRGARGGPRRRVPVRAAAPAGLVRPGGAHHQCAAARQLPPLPGHRAVRRQCDPGPGLRLCLPAHRPGDAAGHRPCGTRHHRLRRLCAPRPGDRHRGL